MRIRARHAPMGDYLLAEKIAELAAIRATERGMRTLVAPVLPFGGADWFGSDGRWHCDFAVDLDGR